MKVLIIAKIDSQKQKHIGVWNKIEDIKYAFNEIGYQCDVFHIKNDCFAINGIVSEDHIIGLSNHKYIAKCRKALIQTEHDIIWIRHNLFNFNFISFLKTRKTKSNLLLYEIPTYPYVLEYHGYKRLLANLHKHLIMNRIKPYVDRLLTHYGNDEKIFGIDAIRLGNGIDPKKFNLLNKGNDNSITFLAIGHLWDWFGLDRLIKSLVVFLRHTPPEEKVKLVVIGKGKEYISLVELVKSENIETCVDFLGWKSPIEIDQLDYSNVIGVGTLCMYRKGINETSSIKHREYCSRGVPFIYTGLDIDFENQLFAYNISNNDSIIDIEKIIAWKRDLSISSQTIRNYAFEKLDWKVKVNNLLKKVIPS